MSREDAWLFGWDETPGIVSVWAEADGRAYVWRRLPGSAELVREDARFRPFVILASLDDLAHLGASLRPARETNRGFTYEELDGPGALRFVVRADDGRALSSAVLIGASQRLGRSIASVRDLGDGVALSLAPEEQYLVATGRTYFRGLGFDDLRRLQFDLETTGLDPGTDRIFLVALRAHDGRAETLEAEGTGDAAEADLIARFVARVRALDPDVIENHNLHGFDVPFLVRRAKHLRVPLPLGRLGNVGLSRRGARRGASVVGDANDRFAALDRRTRYTMPGRELIDTLDAVRRYDFAARDLPGHGLKAVARHLGLAGPEREYVRGAEVHTVFLRDPARIRRYAIDDVNEAAAVSHVLGGAAFALARIAPRRYERLADAGPATGVLDPMLVRAYLHEGAALPAHEAGDGTTHTGAALHLFATGVASRIVKADVASLYPSLMREYRIGPRRDRLGVLVALVDRLVEQRLAAKNRAKTAPSGSAERHTDEALSAAMKIVVNSAYGYLGAVGLTRFADVHAANEVTRHGREVLSTICHGLAERGVTLLEADTDGVYFSVPPSFEEIDERRLVAEVAALLPSRVKLEYDGRYAAMLSHEPKNYALLDYDGTVHLRGVAFRSSRAEPFGEEFLREAIGCLLRGDVRGVRDAFVRTALALRARSFRTYDVSSRVRLTKSPEQYFAVRDRRRELPYEALLANGRDRWSVGEKIRVYRATSGRAGLVVEEDRANEGHDPRDYDVDYYLRVLRDAFASRLARGLAPDDFAAVIADPSQLTLFSPALEHARPCLTVLRRDVIE